jgi:hypothetical protein
MVIINNASLLKFDPGLDLPVAIQKLPGGAISCTLATSLGFMIVVLFWKYLSNDPATKEK